MASPMFLAITADEIPDISPLPGNLAHLGCYVSSTSLTLANLPKEPLTGGGLIIDDHQPILHCDTDGILRQLSKLEPSFILLDFQRPPEYHSMNLATALTQLHCPVPMPPGYADNLDCPVFLPPVPPHIPIEEHIAPWPHREIWLELALDAVQITITEHGSQITPIPHCQPQENAHKDSMLHCHYKITQSDDALQFYCYRTPEDIDALLHGPLPSNLRHTIGLYQEFANRNSKSASH